VAASRLTCAENWLSNQKCVPQWLKPHCNKVSYGTAEAVALSKTESSASFEAGSIWVQPQKQKDKIRQKQIPSLRCGMTTKKAKANKRKSEGK
jgi:hypothetical protein